MLWFGIGFLVYAAFVALYHFGLAESPGKATQLSQQIHAALFYSTLIFGLGLCAVALRRVIRTRRKRARP